MFVKTHTNIFFNDLDSLVRVGKRGDVRFRYRPFSLKTKKKSISIDVKEISGNPDDKKTINTPYIKCQTV